ncbi:MAG: GNAT family N-acetyltransferase [Novosphingobium sp.]|uniref:GNAT family N-acetyltransferase n=1 Tax=Novosphingobium sp. TaxID=1874826 RepID=UPI003B9A7967
MVALIIRLATEADHVAVLGIVMPVIRAGETYALDRDMTEPAVLAYWFGADKQTFVAQAEDGAILGTYYLRRNQPGGGRHVCNCGYMTSSMATGKGVARAMCLHSLEQARAQGFRAMQFNFVVSSNTRAVGLWKSLGFAEVGRLPGAFDHPHLGSVDALVLFRSLADGMV